MEKEALNDLLFIVAYVVIAVVLFQMWYGDYKKGLTGDKPPNAFPGTTPATISCFLVAIAGALVILAIETIGENKLGVSEEQMKFGWLAVFSWISAGFLEELFFRGFLVVESKGRAMLILSIIGFSLLFALFHVDHWLEYDPEASFWQKATTAEIKVTTKSMWTLSMLFLNSIWFYIVRFMPMNKENSLFPCFAAHISSNIGVFIIKIAQGHIEGLV